MNIPTDGYGRHPKYRPNVPTNGYGYGVLLIIPPTLLDRFTFRPLPTDTLQPTRRHGSTPGLGLSTTTKTRRRHGR